MVAVFVSFGIGILYTYEPCGRLAGINGAQRLAMRLVHTADVHLDMCFARSAMASRLGNHRRQSLREVFRSIVSRAGDWPADALLVAGDLFEGDRVNRDTVAFLMSELRSIEHVPVFIAPGNHDPYTSGSPYATETWPKNVTIFRAPEWTPVSVKDGALTVHGFGFDGPEPSANPFGSLRIGETCGTTHVAVAHGSEKSHQPPSKESYAPFDAVEAAADGLAYLALGHFHSLTEIPGDFGTTIYYSGAPEGHGFREPGVRHHIEVEIDGVAVEVNPAVSSRVVYATHTLSCDCFSSSQDLLDAVRRATRDESRSQLARITLTGLCPPAIRSELPSIRDTLAQDFELLEFVDRTESIEDYAKLGREDTSLGILIRRLSQEIADATEKGRRQLLERAREVGLAAFRAREVEIRGLERG
jgi:DNA repair exonuclease SbcCD nuclease subunit